jgi:hypothetical protein
LHFSGHARQIERHPYAGGLVVARQPGDAASRWEREARACQARCVGS